MKSVLLLSLMMLIIVCGCDKSASPAQIYEADLNSKVYDPPANQIVPIGEIPASPTKMEGIGLAFWRPDYQKKFYSDSHTAPTEESKRAAIRQMEEIAKTIGVAPTPEEISRLQLPDGRFTGSRTWSHQSILWDYKNEGDILLYTYVYAYPHFLKGDGTSIKNHNREHLYIIRGETKVRVATQSRVRKIQMDGRFRIVLPGSKDYGRGTPDPNLHL